MLAFPRAAAYNSFMSIFIRSTALALAMAALVPGARSAHAQAAPVPYANSNWLLGLGAVDGGEPSGDALRKNYPPGWFMGTTRNEFALGGFNRAAAFGSFGSLSSEGMQFGYNFKNSPVSLYAGFDTLKYNTAAPGAFAAFDSKSTTLPGAFSANAGIEFRPSSNLSLSLGVGVTQYQSQGLVDSDINSPLLPGQTPLAIGGRPLR